MIKNRTYYDGKPFFKLEKFPHYVSGGKKGTRLNKIHIDFGFIKLVSRVCIEKVNIPLLLDIAYTQNLDLKSHRMSKDGTFVITDIEDVDGGLYFSPKGTNEYLSLDEVWMAHKQGWTILGHGLAGIVEDGSLVGYYGFSHRGGQSFKIGDKIFDPDWKMDEFHPDFKKYKKLLNRSKHSTRIEEVIPYTERGSAEITSLAQAKEAALKMSDHLS